VSRSAVPGIDLCEEIGRGATAVVHRGVRDGRDYAVKILHSGDGVAFRREAATLARLNDPGLPRIHEVGEAGGRTYLIMDLIVGRPLAVLPQRDQVVVLAALGADVAGALAVAHRAGVVHRDVKPANILVGPDGHARLVDFGLASAQGRPSGDVVAGTLLYSAPEQAGMLHRPIDGRTDLYALGVVFFECLTGRPPFVADDAGALVRMHLSEPVPELPATSGPFAAIIGRLLAKDPDDRYQSATGLRHDLLRVSRGDLSGWTVGEADAPARADPELVGRQEQTALLRRRWLRGDGGAVLVEGAPGNGKSRLVRELADAVRDQGGLVLHGKANDDMVPLAPLRQLTGRLVASVQRLPEPARAAAVEELREAAGQAAPVLRALSPALTDLLGVDDGGMATADEQQFAEAVARFLTRVGAGRRVLLHLDDAQWFDASTVRVLGRIADGLAESSLLLVLTARDEPAGSAAVAEVAAACGTALDTRVSVRPLDREAIATLLTGQLGGGTVPADLVERLAVRSGGNPLAAQEYVRAIVDNGLLTPHWGEWRLDGAGLDALNLPTDVLDLVARRVEGLGATGRDLLTVAACCGIRFELPLVAAATESTPGRVAAALAEATALQLVEAAPGGGMVFLHDRIREALLARLDAASIRRLHTRIAIALETQPGDHTYAIAQHHLAGDVGSVPLEAYLATRAAGLRALADHSPNEAVAFLVRAVALAGPADRRAGADVHLAIAVAASLTGDYPLADEHFALARAAEPDALRRAWFRREIANSYLHRGEPSRAINTALTGLAESGHRVPRHPLGLVGATMLALVTGLLFELLPARLRLATGSRLEVARMRADLLGTASFAAGVGMRPQNMMAFTVLALPHVQRIGGGSVYAEVHAGLAICLRVLGLRRMSARVFRRVDRTARDIGDPRITAHTAFQRMVMSEVAPPPGPDTGRLVRDVCESLGPAMDIGERLLLYSVLIRAMLLRGHLREATAVYRRAQAAGGSTENVARSFCGGLGAQLAALAGDRPVALAELSTIRVYAGSLADNTTQLLNHGIAALHVAVETGESGPEVDRLIDEFRASPIQPRSLWSFQQQVWVWIAFLRLAQVAAAADPDERAARIDQVRAAMRDMRRYAKGPLQDAYRDLVRAALAHLSGRHHTALRQLAALSVSAGELDMPLLHFEIARTHARAWTALGCAEPADRLAVHARELAVRHGWRGRADAVQAEFGLERAGTLSGPANPATIHDSRRLTALQQVSLASASVLEPEALARVALDEIVRIFNAERAFLFLAENDLLRPFLGRDPAGADLTDLTGYGASLVDRVRIERTALVVTGSEEGAALGSDSMMAHGLRSIMVAPLLLKGRLIGVIYLDSRVATGIFTADDVDMLAAITSQVAASLETTRVAQLELAVRAAKRERDIAAALRDALAELTASLDPAAVHEVLRRRLTTALPGASVSVTDEALTQADGVSSGLDGDDAWLVMPLRVRGEDRGTVRAGRHGPRFTATEVEVAAALAGQAATALDNALLFQQAQELATRDGLTGLLNRRHFHEIGDRQLRADVRAGRPIAAMMIDIDHFKSINDTHGHPVGDDVIRAIATRLATQLRDADLIGRYGGEEFAVLLAGPADPGATATAAERLRAAVADTPVPTAAGPLPVTVSIGFLHHPTPPDAMTLPAALEHADQALYEAKRTGRNRCAPPPA
jgi:eukaryotic-like serine/threonine-protein kinase